MIFGEKDKRGVLSGEMGVGRWEMGVGSGQCGVFRDRNLEFRKVFSELCAFLVFFVVKKGVLKVFATDYGIKGIDC